MRRLATLILVPPLLLGWALGIALNSPRLSERLIEEIATRLPGLEIASVEGAFSGPLRLEGLDWSSGGLHLHLDRLRLDWRPSALLTGRLRILSLEGEGLRLERRPDPEATPGEPFVIPRLPALRLPLPVDLHRFTLERVTLAGPEGDTQIARLGLGLSAQGDQVRIHHLEFAGMGAEATGRGRFWLAPRLPLRLSLRWRYRSEDRAPSPSRGAPPGEGPFAGLSGEGRLRGNLGHFLLDHRLKVAAFSPASGPKKGPLAPPGSGVKGSLNADRAASTEDRPWAGETRLHLVAGLEAERLRIDRLDVNGPGRVEARGVWSFDDGRFHLHLGAYRQRWPLRGRPQVRIPEAVLDLGGRPEAYSWHLRGHVEAPDLPTMDLQGDGRGGLDHLHLATLGLHTPRSRVRLHGDLWWRPEPRWALDLESDGLDPSEFARGWPGRLRASIHTQGRWPATEKGRRLAVELKALTGTLREHPLKAGGRVELRGTGWQVQDLTLTSGQARIAASGTLAGTLDLNWSLHAGDLGDLLPRAKGRVDASGRARGRPSAPRIQGRVQARGLAFAGRAVKHLKADLDLGLAPGAVTQVRLEASGLDLSGQTWRRLRLNLQGHREHHRLRLRLTDPTRPALRLEAAGGLTPDQTWKGQLETLTLDLHQAGEWHLEAPQALEIGAIRQRLGDACLTHEADRLCYGLDHGQALQAHFDLSRLDLALARPWLPEGVDLKGVLSGRGQIHKAPGAAPVGDLRLALDDSRLHFRLDALEEDLDLSGARLDTRTRGKGLEAGLTLPLGRLGGVEGQAHLADLEDPAAALAGRVEARIGDIGFLAALAPQVTGLKGRFQARAEVSGTRARPRLTLQAELREGAAAIPMTGIELKGIHLQAHSRGLDQVVYDGAITSGGDLKLKGDTVLDGAKGWPTRLHLKGDDFVAADLPEAHVEISPDLTFSHQGDESHLEGTLKIPFARLRPRELPETAVSGSSDLVVSETPGTLADRKQANPHRLHARIRLVLGKRVSFDGLGLRARFAGDLVIQERPHRPPTANGRLSIEEGTYRAYGQDLSITQGLLFYADTPVDNPGIQLRAERKVGEVTAGLEVRGTLKRPKLTLYSEPSMTQNAILSYLVLGHAPGEGGDTDLGSAAAGALAGRLAAEAGRQLGLDQLRVDNAANLKQAALVAGTYLSPDVYVEYVQHVYSRSVNLKIRYDINDRLQLESETGDTQGVDLYYTIEH